MALTERLSVIVGPSCSIVLSETCGLQRMGASTHARSAGVGLRSALGCRGVEGGIERL
ncbi:MAG: hypothetical protein P8R54_33065 [Myxococcota bacterium]|nr:hypothetical protein [Myxococcota bacterium]